MCEGSLIGQEILGDVHSLNTKITLRESVLISSSGYKPSSGSCQCYEMKHLTKQEVLEPTHEMGRAPRHPPVLSRPPQLQSLTSTTLEEPVQLCTKVPVFQKHTQ